MTDQATTYKRRSRRSGSASSESESEPKEPVSTEPSTPGPRPHDPNATPLETQAATPAKPKPKRKGGGNEARDRRRAVRRTKSDYAAIALARKHSVEAIEFMVSVMRGDPVRREIVREDGEVVTINVAPDIPERVKAAKELLDRGMGKPVARKEVTHSIHEEHLAALKQLAADVRKMEAREDNIIDVTPARTQEERDRAKLGYADARR